MKSTNFAEILNYTESSKTTLKNTNYGASNLLYKQDATGRFIGMADDNLIEFNGDGRYVDTEWVPDVSGNLTTEIVLQRNTLLKDSIIGCTDDATARYGFGYTTSGVIQILIGDTFPAFSTTGLDHIMLVTNGTPSESEIYLNGVKQTWTKPTVLDTPISNFFFGRLGTSTNKNVDVGLFKVHKNKALTADEVATAYAEAKTMYPTLS